MKSYNGGNSRSTTPRKQKSSKENADPNTMRSPLPPRPPSAASLKRKLAGDSATPPSSSRAASSSAVAAGYSDSGVKVVVRVRPPNTNEEEGEAIIEKVSNDTLTISGHTFTFDSIADTEATQVDIFELVGAPLVENCLAGFNSSVFAYGQTGSGKTYTIWGPANALSTSNPMIDQQGLTPRVFQRLFERISEEQTKHADKQLVYQCRCSFLEIYNEQITDLLDPTQKNLQIREDVKTGVYVENLTEEYVSTMKDVMQLLIKGFSNRRIGATSINAESSRSHSVFTCVVESRYKMVENGLSCFKTSRINLVDLAGSERQKLTGAAGERLKEAGNINRSLSQLGNLINILAEVSHSGKQRHVPYRDSKLTFLLQESLGGNAKLAMICAISPAQSCKSETFSTLRFAQRAKAVKNKAVVNEETQDDVNVLREVIRQLKEELLRMKSNGNQTYQNENFSSRWNARRSLNLLKSLNHPLALRHVDNDSDEEMEIVEEAEDNAEQVPELERSEQTLSLELQPRVHGSPCEDRRCPEDADVDMEEAVEPSIVFAELQTCPKPGTSHDICNEGCNISASAMEDADSKSQDPMGNNKSTTDLGIILSDVSPTPKSPTPSVSPRARSSRKSIRTSSPLTATQRSTIDTKLDSEAEHLSSTKPSNSISLNSLSAQRNSLCQVPTESLAASLHRGLEIIDSHRKSAALRQSTFRFSCKLADMKAIVPIAKVDVGIQTLPDHQLLEDVSSASLCSKCKTLIYPDESKDAGENADMQLVAVNPDMQLVPSNELESCDKNQVPKAVEKVLAGAIRREMALEEICTKQNAEIMQLNRLVQQYKHERECSSIISQTREDKIIRLESLMEGVLPTEEFMDEELLSLIHEHRLLKEKYENHPEVLRVKIELQRIQDELERYRNFFDMGERDVLVEEIQDLRRQLQSYIDSKWSKKRSAPVLQLTYESEPRAAPSLSTVPESIEEVVEHRLEQERIKWTEAESNWVTLVEELRLELETNRTLYQRQKQELDTEKKCLEELKEAMQLAMEGHARMLEQYVELEEKHIQLLARHRKIRDGIEDVKKAAAKCGVRGAESRFIDALAAEISALKVEREKERRYFRDENRGLQAQLRDTAEAVQAAGELLVRLKEAEGAIAAAEKRAIDAEEAVQAYKQIDKLKKNHAKEMMNALNQQLADSRLPKEEAPKAVYDDLRTPTDADSSLLSRQASKPVYDDLKMASYDAGEAAASKPVYDDDDIRTDDDHLRWKEEFEPFYNGEQEEVLSKLGEQPPSLWFSGYDRCNI